MATLTDQTILSTYQSLLKVGSNGNLTTSLLQISDGIGNNSPLYLSTTLAAVNSNLLVGTTTDYGYKLDVNGNFRAINSGVIGNSSAFSGGFAGLVSIRKDLDVTAGGTYRNGQLAIGSTSNNGALVLGYSTTGAGTIQAAVLGASFSPLTIQAYGGNVLVGTTTDAGYKLYVDGTAKINGIITIGNSGTAGTLNINRSSDGANVGFIKAESSGGGIQIGSGINMFFSNNGKIVVNSITTDASAIFKIDSTTLGFLPPRMTNAQRTSIASPAVGLIVYCTDAVEGLYIYKSTGWTFVI